MSSTTTTQSNGSKTIDGTPDGAFPLSINSLESLCAYVPHPSGLGLVSSVSLPAGSLFCPITAIESADTPTIYTLQVSPTSHILFTSALNYMNHSCDPSVEVDVDKMEVRVVKNRDLKEGDELSFFYPSTEWRMEGQFKCLCGAGEGKCVGKLRGAEALSREDLNKRFTNSHILKMAEERDAAQK